MGFKKRQIFNDRFRDFIDVKQSNEELTTDLGLGDNKEFNSNQLLMLINTDQLKEKRRILNYLARKNWKCAFDPEAITNLLTEDVQCKYLFEKFTSQVMNWMAVSALHLSDDFPYSLPRLQIGKNLSNTLTKSSVCNILSAIFLGATPLSHRFLSNFAIKHITLRNKLYCIINYFQTMYERESTKSEIFNPSLTYTRLCSEPKSLNYWVNSTTILTDFYFDDEGRIEDVSTPCLMVDFANKLIGGGTMRMGCVQEEIMFVENPECIASILMCDMMEDNEAIVIVGAERFSCHEGYDKYFKYTGPYKDMRKYDQHGRLDSHIVAIDGLVFKKKGKEQYDDRNILRELNKACVGFQGDPLERQDFKDGTVDQLRPVCTGKWGCGVYGGDPQLKALIQWAAASENSRGMIFMTFKDRSLTELSAVIQKYSKQPVGRLISDILSVCPSLSNSRNSSLFSELLN